MLVLLRYNQICLYQPLRRLGKVLFSQLSVCLHPVGHIFQVLLGGIPQSWLGDTPVLAGNIAQDGVPPPPSADQDKTVIPPGQVRIG